MSSYKKEKEVALRAVREACRLCADVQSALVSEDSMAKKDRSPVTVADFGAQAVILSRLAQAFPDDPAVAEEDSGELRSAENAELLERVVANTSAIDPAFDRERVLAAIDGGNDEGGAKGRFWTLDPIDGTKGFLRRQQYAVALALIEDGEVVFGVLGCPNLPFVPGETAGESGALFYATKGEGARTCRLDGSDDGPISVMQLKHASEGIFCESVEAAHSAHGTAARVADRLAVTADPIRLDSQCKYAAVARGEAAIYLRLPTRKGYQEKIWDHAAGAIVLTEAGGRCGDIEGKPLDFSRGPTLAANCGIIATSGPIFDEVVEAVVMERAAQATKQ